MYNVERTKIQHKNISTLQYGVTYKSGLTVRLNKLIAGFHRASLISVTFINQLMHSIITVIDVKILLYKSLKDTH
jgi:ribosomal protein S1